jgi:hypothetical protein
MDRFAALLEVGDDDGDVVSPPRRPRGRRGLARLRLLAPVLLVGAIVFAGLAGDGAAVAARPDAATAAAAWADPCGLVPRPQLGALVDGTLGASDDYREGAVASCLHRGVPGSAVLFLDVQLVTEASLLADTTTGPLSGLTDLDGALERLRAESVSPPVQLAGLGDEAWVLDTNIRTVWARQGAVLLGVVVAPAEGPDDVEAAQALAGLLLRALAA